jgi:murein DD-endopeptidase MepM/ murein hydrolase activator NlpD
MTSHKFTGQKLLAGLYEPEGIYLNAPLEGDLLLIQPFAAHPEHYALHRYSGVPMKGHEGVDFAVKPGAKILAADRGRVTEISSERGGYERYIKLEHRWGESLYANVGEIAVESGQLVERGAELATVLALPGRKLYVHFGVRIQPFNRFDGWGGFSDPLPFLLPTSQVIATDEAVSVEGNPLAETAEAPIHPILTERPGMRRP